MFATLLTLSAFLPAQVDLLFQPTEQTMAVDSVAEISLIAHTAAPEQFVAVCALLSWDPGTLELLSADGGGFPWFVFGFLPDPDGINLDTTDGEALFTALAPPGTPAGTPPDIVVTTLRFKVLAEGVVSLVPMAGAFGETRVISTVPGVEITGDISSTATVRVNAPSFCYGLDGSLAFCPCANPGLPESGCDIPAGTGGVRLDVIVQRTTPLNRVTVTGTGYPIMSMPSAVLIRAATQEPNPVVFGDGLLCVGTPVVRLAATFASAGVSTHTFGHGVSGGDYFYQLWFRSQPVMFCDPTAAFNLSNGRRLTW